MWYNSATSGGLVLNGTPVKINPVSGGEETVLEIVSNGFIVHEGEATHTNANNTTYYYIAL